MVRLGESVNAARRPAPQLERKMEDRFVEPSRRERSGRAELEVESFDPTPTPSPRKATIRVWRRAGEPRFAARSARERELDRV